MRSGLKNLRLKNTSGIMSTSAKRDLNILGKNLLGNQSAASANWQKQVTAMGIEDL
jgi:hypothetical protein